MDVLGMIAGYNDKGAEWSGHDASQVQRLREQTQEQILRLVAEVGERHFSPMLLESLQSGRAVEDSSGRFASAAQDELL
ncbi:hypothetical protein [Microbacterium sp. P04]|uniref:hypothetical protein n=1 Tax=Microbacterium sp. P04 TaxID=3366947 RepID=UPI003745E272